MDVRLSAFLICIGCMTHMTSSQIQYSSSPGSVSLGTQYQDLPPVVTASQSYRGGQGNPLLALLSSPPSTSVVQGPGQNCFKIPAYARFNITNQSYYYPKDQINTELTVRKDVLQLIFNDGVKVISPYDEKEVLYNPTTQDKQSSVGDGVKTGGLNQGCAAYRLLLQSFDLYGGHCWVVHPRHQAVSYVTCGAPKCQRTRVGGKFAACAVEERTATVWAWCETLPLGRRITKISLPLPVDCKCQVYDC